MNNPLLTAAFVIAATQFFKTQFGLVGKYALLCAFVVALIVGLAPVAAASFPTAEPWITTVVGIVALFIGAAGTYDFAKSLTAK